MRSLQGLKKAVSYVMMFAIIIGTMPNITALQAYADEPETVTEAEVVIGADTPSDEEIEEDGSELISEGDEEPVTVQLPLSDEYSSDVSSNDLNIDKNVESSEEIKSVEIVSEKGIKPVFDKKVTVDEIVVSVFAEEGVFPKDAEVDVKKVTPVQEMKALDAVTEEREEEQNIVSSYSFDIKVLDVSGNEIEPEGDGKVKVSFKLAEVANDNLEVNIYHVTEDEIADDGSLTAEKLDVTTEGDVAEAETDGFSIYTVEFTYANLQYVLSGDDSIPLVDILTSIGLTGEVSEVSVSDDSLFSAIKNDSGEWMMYALKPFDTTEWLKVVIDGIEYEITVTDSRDTSEWIGSGTLSDPWKIKTAANLKKLADDVNSGDSYSGCYFILANDIDLGSVCGASVGGAEVNWPSIGSSDHITFYGNFDGDGHSITGLYINQSGSAFRGLFGAVTGTVKNLSVSGTVTGENYTGGIVGANYGTIENCHFVSGDVHGKSYIGGIAGFSAPDCEVTDCSSDADVYGNGSAIGGIVGWANNISDTTGRAGAGADENTATGGAGKVYQCTFSGTLNGTAPLGAAYSYYENGKMFISYSANAYGGIVGWSNGYTIDSCSNDGTVNGVDFTGGVVGDTTAGARIVNCDNNGTVSSEALLVGGVAGRVCESLISDCENNGTVDADTDTGKGELIGGIAGVVDKYSSISVCRNNAGSYVYGNKYVAGIVGLSNMTISGCDNSGDVTAKSHAGGVAGWTTCDVINCSNDGNITVTGPEGNVGGIVGHTLVSVSDCSNLGTIKSTGNGPATGGIAGSVLASAVSCTNSGTVIGAERTGGIAGENDPSGSGGLYFSNITDCDNTGAVSGGNYTGGVVGITAGYVKNCNNIGGVISGANATGGVAGYVHYDISECTNSGNVTGGTVTGGIVGNVKGVNGKGVESCTNETGTVISGGEKTGGIIGQLECFAKDCINYGEVNGSNKYTGGIAGIIQSSGGSVQGTISYCENNGNISGTDENTGGIAGMANIEQIKDCQNSGAITGEAQCVGGIVGMSNTNISDCANSGAIAGNGDNTAGIAGTQYQHMITGCSNSGIITGNAQDAAGIVGMLYEASIDNCINSGSVSGAGNSSAGIVGLIVYSSVTECSNSASISGVKYVGGIVGTTTHSVTGGGSVCLVSDCINESTATVQGQDSCVGGVVGYLTNGSVKNCSNNASVTGIKEDNGGIIGQSGPGTSLENCVNRGAVTGSNLGTGGIIGSCKGTLCKCENSGEVSGTGNSGGIAGYLWEGGYISECTNYSEVSGTGTAVGGVVGCSKTDISDCVNKGTNVSSTNDNVGGIVGAGKSVSKCINKADVTTTGCAAGGIAGSSDGNVIGCRNSGNVQGDESIGGTVGVKNGGKIESSINSGDITGTFFTGGISGWLKDSAAVSGCSSSGAVGGTQNVGGIVGGSANLSSSPINSCKNSGDVIGTGENIGGVIGLSNGTVTDCENKGAVLGTGEKVGGVVGAALKEITSCINKGNVTGDNKYTGGVAGYAEKKISYCSNDGAVVGKIERTGGIAGTVEGGSVENCRNEGTVTGVKYIGGIAGSSGVNIIGCSNGENASIDSSDKARINSNNPDEKNKIWGMGGICGFTEKSITGCYNLAAVGTSIEYGTCVGGIVGQMNRSSCRTELCINRGTVKGQIRIGGIVGNCFGTISQCRNEGNIRGGYWTDDADSLAYVGGIVGQQSGGTIEQCANRSWNSDPDACSVIAEGCDVGGIAGHTNGTVINCYNRGRINGYSVIGGVVGGISASSQINRNYCFALPDSGYGVDYTSIYGDTQLCGAISGKYEEEAVFNYNYAVTGTDIKLVGGHRILAPESQSNDGKYEWVDLDNNILKPSVLDGFDFVNTWQEDNVYNSKAPILRCEANLPVVKSTVTTSTSYVYTPPADIHISNEIEFEYFRDEVNEGKSYKGATVYLDADLDLSEITDWVPIGNKDSISEQRPFSGTFDGQGHYIKGLSVSGNSGLYHGLFGYILGGTVKDLAVYDASVIGTDGYIGGIVGRSDAGVVNGCEYYGDVEARGGMSSSYVGGIVGYNANAEIDSILTTATVTNCCNIGSVKSYGGANESSFAGGIAGNNDSGSITYCYHYTGAVTPDGYGTATKYGGGIVGNTKGGTVSNSYYVKEGSTASLDPIGHEEEACTKTNLFGRDKAAFNVNNTFTNWGLNSSSAWVMGQERPLLNRLSYSITLVENYDGDGWGINDPIYVLRANASLPARSNEYVNSRDYFFSSWNENQAGTGKSYSNCAVLTDSDVTDRAITLYGQWRSWESYWAIRYLDSSKTLTNVTIPAMNAGENYSVEFATEKCVKPAAFTISTDSSNASTMPPSWKLEAKMYRSDSYTIIATSSDTSALKEAGQSNYYLLEESVSPMYYSYYRLTFQAGGGTDDFKLGSVSIMVNDYNTDVRDPIVFDKNDSSATGTTEFSSNSDNKNLNSITLPLNGFVKDGSFFTGWVNERTYETVPNGANVTVDGRTTFIAQWADGVRYSGYVCDDQVDEVLFDDDPATKWDAPASKNIEFYTKHYIKLTGLTLTTGDDQSKAFKLEAKAHEADRWTTILDEPAGFLPETANVPVTVSLGMADDEYCYFRFTYDGSVDDLSFIVTNLSTDTRLPKITFNAHGGRGTMSAQQNGENRSSVSLNANEFTRNGFGFAEWNTKADGSGTSYDNAGTYPVKEDATLYAQWTTNTYDIDFYDEEGTTLLSRETVAAGKIPVYKGEPPKKSATDDYIYTFKGWSPALEPVSGTASYNAAFTEVSIPKPTPPSTPAQTPTPAPTPTPKPAVTPAPEPAPVQTPEEPQEEYHEEEAIVEQPAPAPTPSPKPVQPTKTVVEEPVEEEPVVEEPEVIEEPVKEEPVKEPEKKVEEPVKAEEPEPEEKDKLPWWPFAAGGFVLIAGAGGYLLLRRKGVKM